MNVYWRQRVHQYLRAVGEPSWDWATEMGAGRLLLPLSPPTEYKRIAKLLHERRLDREHYIEEFVGHLRAEMKAEGVKAEVYGRPKHTHSIWRKMQKRTSPSMSCLMCVRYVLSPSVYRIVMPHWG